MHSTQVYVCVCQSGKAIPVGTYFETCYCYGDTVRLWGHFFQVPIDLEGILKFKISFEVSMSIRARLGMG